MLGNQPHSSRQAPEKKEPRKPRRHGFARQRMTPTRRVEHAVAVCPDCGTHLNGGWVQRTREVIELPVAPVEVTEHALVARICPVCQRRRLPKEALQGVVLGQQRLGVNLVSLMVTLREEGRLPIRIIQWYLWYLETVHQLHLSVGAIVQAVHGVARQAETAVREVLEQVRASPVVQGDETGWRQDGSNGYVWTFSTPSERYFLRRGRDKGVVDEVLDSSRGWKFVSSSIIRPPAWYRKRSSFIPWKAAAPGVPSAYELANGLIDSQYPTNLWNVYAFHFSDGEDFSPEDSMSEAKKLFNKGINMFGYGEIHVDENYRTYGNLFPSFKETFPLVDSNVTSDGISVDVASGGEDLPFLGVVIQDRKQIWPALREFLKKDRWTQ